MKKYIETDKEVGSVLAFVLEASSGDFKAARLALEDGNFLTNSGYTDSDQGRIEEAHYILSEIENKRAADFIVI